MSIIRTSQLCFWGYPGLFRITKYRLDGPGATGPITHLIHKPPWHLATTMRGSFETTLTSPVFNLYILDLNNSCVPLTLKINSILIPVQHRRWNGHRELSNLLKVSHKHQTWDLNLDPTFKSSSFIMSIKNVSLIWLLLDHIKCFPNPFLIHLPSFLYIALFTINSPSFLDSNFKHKPILTLLAPVRRMFTSMSPIYSDLIHSSRCGLPSPPPGTPPSYSI